MGSSNRPPRARRRPGPGLPGLTTRSPRLDLDGTVTACVPRSDLVRPVAAGLADLTPREATSPDIVRARLPVTRAVLGPALLYPPAGFKAHRIPGVEEACRGDVEDLITSASPDELDESRLREITGPLFISRASTGDVAAACGYRCWPNHVAHLSVLTHSTHRRERPARRGEEYSDQPHDRRAAPPAMAGTAQRFSSTRPPTRPGRARSTTQPGARLSSRSGKSGTWAGSP